MRSNGIVESDSMKACLEEIVKQLKIANSLKKVEMCYNQQMALDNFYKGYSIELHKTVESHKQKLMNDFNQAIDMAFDA